MVQSAVYPHSPKVRNFVTRTAAAVVLLAAVLFSNGAMAADEAPASAPAVQTEQAAPAQQPAAQAAQVQAPDKAQAAQAAAANPDAGDQVDNHPWWFWPGCLMVALAGALAAGPGLLRRNLASLRLALPVALIASACSILGAVIGLALPTTIVQTCLGCTILGIACLLLFSKNSVRPIVTKQDAIGLALGMHGSFLEPTTGEVVDWKTHHTLVALLLFIVIGIMAGMFGLGAGWANVPVLNLLMGVPLKVGVGTSKFLLSITDTAAAWVYLNQGCVIPLMAIPSIVGLMLGSIVGVRLLAVAKPKVIRYMVIIVLFFSGIKALMKGLGW